MSFPHLLCCSFLTQQECGSNSILIKYFLEAKNHLPPQRRAHCYVPLLRSISWWCGDINIFWSIRCIAWLYLDEFGTLEASYQICMSGISAQTNLERPSQTVFSEWPVFVTFCETIPRLSTPCHHGKNPGILCSGLPSKAKIQNWGHSRLVQQSHRGNWYVWTPNRQLKLPYILGGNSGIGYETVKVSNVCYMCSTSWSIGS